MPPVSPRCCCGWSISWAIILVLLFLTLIGGIIWKSTTQGAESRRAPPAMLDLGLAPGVRSVTSAELDGDRLVVNTGEEIDRHRPPQERAWFRASRMALTPVSRLHSGRGPYIGSAFLGELPSSIG